MYSVKLLEYLKTKLTTGNRRSIHLNALPGNLLNRVDVADLDLLQPKLAEKLIQNLLNQPKFSLTLNYENSKSIYSLTQEEQKKLQILQKKINALFYENNDNYLEHGTKPFGIGYPLLIKRDRQDPTKIIKAPVLIWNLEIEKSSTHAFRWIIRRNDDFAVYLNQVLLSHIELDEGILLQNLASQYDFDNPLTEQGIVNLCNDLLKQLNAGDEYPVATIAVCPGPDTLKNMDFVKPVLRWSAVLGIYKTQKQSIIRDYEQLIALQQKNPSDISNAEENPDTLTPFDFFPENGGQNSIIFPTQKPTSFQQHNFVCIKTDPSQQAVVNNLTRTYEQIIQGPPGTGKSRSLTAVISNALANHAKCLVVCEKRTALEVVQNNLSDIGLGGLTVIIEDISKDRSKVIDIVRNTMDEHPVYAQFSEHEFVELLSATKKLEDHIRQTHLFLDRKLLHHWNWTDLCGKYLIADSQLKPNEKIINNSLDCPLSEQPSAGYTRLVEVVNTAQLLYNKVQTLQHPLTAIHPSLFSTFLVGELQFKIQNAAVRSIEQLQTLTGQIETLINDYSQQLEIHYREVYAQFFRLTDDLNIHIEQNLKLYGQDFNRLAGPGKMLVKMASLVSEKHRKIIQAQQVTIEMFAQICQYFSRHSYFEYHFPDQDIHRPEKIELIQQHLLQFHDLFEIWHDQLPNQIERETATLKYSKPHPALNMEARLEFVKNSYNQFAETHNRDGYLYDQMPEQSDLPDTHLSIVRRTQHLWEQVLKNLNIFREFYDWQRFFFGLSEPEQQLIKEIILLNTNKWQPVFEQWYFHRLLQFLEQNLIPRHDQDQRQYQQLLARLRALQAIKINNEWKRRQRQTEGRFNHNNAGFNIKQLYNKRGTKGQQRNPLRKIIHTDVQLFTDYFPVLLVNPVVCSSIIPLKENLFEVVIFDEASQLRLEETFTALLRGRYKIVSGDTHQMPPTSYFDTGRNITIDAAESVQEDDFEAEPDPEDMKIQDIVVKESLLAYAEDIGFNRSFLDFHYRSRHPDLIAFSNAAFYGSRLITLPVTEPYQPIRFVEVNGIYDKNTNVAEIDAIMHILINEIVPSTSSYGQIAELPTVGVATFNIYQRNLLLETIEQHKLKDESLANHFAILEANGFFVKNLENIQGDERDIMIISTTFGRKPDGQFIQNFGPINQDKGYKLLNVIITRARQKVYICTSIPSEYYSKYISEIEKSGNSGKGIFYAYLSYAKAIETGNHEFKQSILNLLQRYCIETMSRNQTHTGESDLFIGEIAQRLSEVLPGYEVNPFARTGGFVIDIELIPFQNNLSPIALECDNSGLHQLEEAPLNDIYRQEQLNRLGYHFIRTYSINWWLNPQQTLEDLILQIKTIRNSTN